MTLRPLLAAAMAILGTLATAIAADPVVSNLSAAQRQGTKLVDIRYDVTADTPTVKVTLYVSSDGGSTWAVPVTAITGAVGDSIAVGTGRSITWEAHPNHIYKSVIAAQTFPASCSTLARQLPETSGRNGLEI